VCSGRIINLCISHISKQDIGNITNFMTVHLYHFLMVFAFGICGTMEYHYTLILFIQISKSVLRVKVYRLRSIENVSSKDGRKNTYLL
jgi:hypothetical protein